MRNTLLKSVLCLTCTFAATILHAQGGNETTNDTNGSIEDIPAKPMRLPALQEVNGSPFLNADYILGTVQLTNDKTVSPVPVRFNIYSNAVMIQKDGSDLRLESFHMVSYDQTTSDGTVKHFHFKAGYPDIDDHTDKSIYQVLAFGPVIHVMKFLSQKVEDVTTLGDYSRREIVTSEQLYIYLPGGAIMKIKLSKSSLEDAAPALTPKIEEIINAKKIKLRSENDLVQLADELNKS